MTPMNRILPLACAIWMLALFLATPRAAQTTAEARNGEAAKPKGHPDLSLFTHSENCVACHNNLMSASGEDVSIGSTWRSTMMVSTQRLKVRGKGPARRAGS